MYTTFKKHLKTYVLDLSDLECAGLHLSMANDVYGGKLLFSEIPFIYTFKTNHVLKGTFKLNRQFSTVFTTLHFHNRIFHHLAIDCATLSNAFTGHLALWSPRTLTLFGGRISQRQPKRTPLVDVKVVAA